jgi:hypothetical protein
MELVPSDWISRNSLFTLYFTILRHFHRIAKSDHQLCHCLSVYLSAWNNSAPAGRIFYEILYLSGLLLGNLSRKFKFHQHLTIIMCTSREDLCTYEIM